MKTFQSLSGRECTAVARPSRALVLSAATPPRPVFATWITSPLTAAAFCPRLWAGALVKGPGVVSELADSISEIATTTLANSSMTSGEKSDTVADIVNKQLDSLLVRGARVEREVFDRMDSVIDTSFIRPDVPQPLEPITEEYISNPTSENMDATYAEAVPTMPTSESRTSSALLQLQAAIANVQASLAEIDANDTPSKIPMLRLNTREAWEALKMRVAELESSPVEGVESAVDEAKSLVTELGEAFKFS